MDIDISVNKRQITPYKVAVKQFESETTTLVFTLDNYKWDQVDLRNYKAFVVTSINGLVDITELAMSVNGTEIKLTWVVQERTLRYAGAIVYQIVFKENADDGDNTAVFNTYEAILQCSESIDAERPIQANYPTIFKQWYDLMQTLAGTFDAGVIHMPVGESVPLEERLAGRLYYQIENDTTYEGHFEDHEGKRLGYSSADFLAKYVPNADLDTLSTHGEYICAGTMMNTPVANTYCMVRVTDSASTNRIIQEVYVPDSDGNVRVFMRATASSGTTFGAWREIDSSEYVSAMLDDKDFEIQALMDFHSKELLDMYIETFENTSSLSTIPDGYDSRMRRFNIAGTSEMVFKTYTLSDSRSRFWINVEPSSSAITRQVSVDGGSTWTTVSNNTLTTISPTTRIGVKLKFSGSVTLKNVAFGLK